MFQFIRRYRCTLLVSLIAIVAWRSPMISDWLQLDYARLADGEWWRLWTGHLTHFGGNHLFFDLLMFVVLGSACERDHPRQFAAWTGLMMLGVAAFVGFSEHEIEIYRGLSGVDTGLFVWFVVDQYRRCRINRERIACIGWSIALLALTGKLVYELASGQTLFVDSSSFTPLVESHLAGGALGLAASLTCASLSGRGSAGTRLAGTRWSDTRRSTGSDESLDNVRIRIDVAGTGQRL